MNGMNFIDSCAFDPKYAPEEEASKKLFNLHEKGVLRLKIVHSTSKEIDHPNTPSWVKNQAASMIYTLPVNLISEERQRFREILKILTGNGKAKNFEMDAQHIFDCQRYHGNFITTDGRILQKRDDLKKMCGIDIYKPVEFLQKKTGEVSDFQ